MVPYAINNCLYPQIKKEKKNIEFIIYVLPYITYHQELIRIIFFRHTACIYIYIFSDCFIKHYNISDKFTKKKKKKNKKVHSPNDRDVCLVKLTYIMKTTIGIVRSLSLLKFIFIELKCPKKKKKSFSLFSIPGCYFDRIEFTKKF